MDSPWDEEAGPNTIRDSEWTKISSEFTTTGYREGITAGKESALQEGFDAGFATIGAPIGREVGILRGTIFALLDSLSLNGGDSPGPKSVLIEARSIAYQLSRIRFSEIAPRDVEAEAHALEHLKMDEEDAEIEENDEIAQKRQMEGLEDMLARLTPGDHSDPSEQYKLTLEDVQNLKRQTLSLCTTMGLSVDWS
ncbi:hypothetical protein J3R30DRAFT_2402234 [Lentinula aciculospora]|uniref:Protein YAE1 n=1 Tax=Lentinula aciculospora TaxID=153920 RepID=A0A9W9AES6_9AGAR|nr:hypothetical protein J3R30DRAFT_2402234 [Lentinula aciculospora]